MVTIVKDENKKIVTKGAYDNFYKPLGYTIVVEKPIEKETIVTEKVKKDEGNKKTSKAVEYKKR